MNGNLFFTIVSSICTGIMIVMTIQFPGILSVSILLINILSVALNGTNVSKQLNN